MSWPSGTPLNTKMHCWKYLPDDEISWGCSCRRAHNKSTTKGCLSSIRIGDERARASPAPRRLGDQRAVLLRILGPGYGETTSVRFSVSEMPTVSRTGISGFRGASRKLLAQPSLRQGGKKKQYRRWLMLY